MLQLIGKNILSKVNSAIFNSSRISLYTMAGAIKNKKGTKRGKDLNGNAVSAAKRHKSSAAAAIATNGDVDSSSDYGAEEEGAFENFKIRDETIEKLKAKGINYLFPIQAKTFKSIYKGKDIIAQARTGTGKTLSFALPLVEKLSKKNKGERGRPPRALVMAPTRELAKQVSGNFEELNDSLSVCCVYGGTAYAPQESAMRRGLDVIVGTPGRLLDYVQKGTLDMSCLKHLVLDEVDMMLDMGFAESVDEILKSSFTDDRPKPQVCVFSATVPPWVFETAKKYMNPEREHIDLIGNHQLKTALTVKHFAIKSNYHDRASAIGDVLKVYSGNHGRAMVFCQTKRDADELACGGDIKQDLHVMHGDIPQAKREMVLEKFRSGIYRCLVTTDVAARGLDIPEVDLVIQCAPPKDVDSYIHRSGRTGRAGKSGIAVCFYKPQEEYALKNVEKLTGINFKRIGAPTAEDIVVSAASDAAKTLDDVPQETLEHFYEAAEKLIEEKGAKNAIAAALAVLSGNTEMKTRSLLTAAEGYTTYLFKTDKELFGVGYCYRSLERCLPEEIKEKAKGMRLLKDKMGCVFDLPSIHDKDVEDRWQSKYDTLEKATELPELLEFDNKWGGSRGGSNWSSGGGGGGRGGSSSYNKRGGYGGGGNTNRRGGFNNRSNRSYNR